MNKSMVAGAAFIFGIAIAAPMLAWSASDSEPQLAQSGPDQRSTEMGGGPAGGFAERDERGPMGEHHGWMRGMMQRMMQLSPQQRCEERLARRAGIIAYTVAKLNLTAQQRPLWDALQAQIQAAGDRQRQLCATLKPFGERGQETLLDRLNRREQFLTAQLQAVQQTKPMVEQLYQILTPEQKAIVNHPFMHR